MKQIFLQTLAVAGLISAVASKLSFGHCPRSKDMKIFFNPTVLNPYDLTVNTDAYLHEFAAMDEGFRKADSNFKKATGLSSQCGDWSDINPFKQYAADLDTLGATDNNVNANEFHALQYPDSWLNNPSEEHFIWWMVHFDDWRELEYQYFCVDS
jgi:hypothetical protein